MNSTTRQIEVITQSVLRELRSRGVTVAAGTQLNTAPKTKSTVLPSPGVGLNGKVITEDSLAAANAAGKTVSIPRDAVITPSGHDYIRRNNVTVTSGNATTITSSPGVLIFTGRNNAASSAAGTAKWEAVEAACEFEAASKTLAALPKSVVCSVGEPSTTACLLNRDPDIRAAVITQETDLGRLGTNMNPHVLCLNSVGWSFAALLRLFRDLSTADNAVPPAWKEIARGNA